MGLQFHETVMGRRFFEGNVPRLIKAIEEQNALLRAQNELIAKQTLLLGQMLNERNKCENNDDTFDLPI